MAKPEIFPIFLSNSMRWLGLLCSFRWIKPSIQYFEPHKPLYFKSDQVHLLWRVKGAWKIVLLPENKSVTPIGHFDLQAVVTRGFLIKAHGLFGKTTADCMVWVTSNIEMQEEIKIKNLEKKLNKRLTENKIPKGTSLPFFIINTKMAPPIPFIHLSLSKVTTTALPIKKIKLITDPISLRTPVITLPAANPLNDTLSEIRKTETTKALNTMSDFIK